MQTNSLPADWALNFYRGDAETQVLAFLRVLRVLAPRLPKCTRRHGLCGERTTHNSPSKFLNFLAALTKNDYLLAFSL